MARDNILSNINIWSNFSNRNHSTVMVSCVATIQFMRTASTLKQLISSCSVGLFDTDGVNSTRELALTEKKLRQNGYD